MDQFITLLSNLFNLTKVASVTLPGLAMAAVVAYIFRPPPPVDIVAITSPTFQVESLPPTATPCSHITSGTGKNSDNGCKSAEAQKSLVNPRLPACSIRPVNLNQFNEPLSDTQWTEALDDFVTTEFFVEKVNGQLPPDPAGKTKSKIMNLARGNELHPWDPRPLKQFILEHASERLSRCDDIEQAWKGQEEADNAQLTTDIANLDKQRSDLQDAYIASLKANNAVLTINFRHKLEAILDLANQWRERYRLNLVSINERTRRLAEIKKQQDIIASRLSEPGRLRPIPTFDLYTQGLLNHIVGIILLSLALSLILNAFDRAVFGTLFELLMRGW